MNVSYILMVDVIIREASDKDIPIILGLLYDLGRPKPQKDSDVEAFRKLVKKYVTDLDKKILVAEFDDMKIVGMVSIVFLSRLNQTTLEMYIPELVVLEKYQNQGIGKKLINSCIVLAKDKKCHRIRLESGNIRKKSHQFYKHLGFEQSALSFTKNLTRNKTLQQLQTQKKKLKSNLLKQKNNSKLNFFIILYKIIP